MRKTSSSEGSVNGFDSMGVMRSSRSVQASSRGSEIDHRRHLFPSHPHAHSRNAVGYPDTVIMHFQLSRVIRTAMMDAEDEPPMVPTLLSPSSPSTQLRSKDEPCGYAEREMFHFRRPDISTRRVFFQRRNSNGTLQSPLSSVANVEPVPVQLLTMDGQCYFGTPYAANVAGSGGGAALASDPLASPRNNSQEGRLARVSMRLGSLD